MDASQGNVKKQVANTVKSLCATYRFQSLGEYRALLSLYNISLEEVRGEVGGREYHGFVYSATDGQGNKVTFSSSWQAITEDGRYGIPALQDAYVLESVLVRTEGDKTFLPTRCGFTWDAQSTTATTLQIKHITGTEGMETSISRLRAEGTEVNVYDTAGNLILRSTTVSKAQQQLPKGIYVIGGEKFAVK